MSDTSDQVIILTGSSRGLGLAVLEALVNTGARVVTISRSKSEALCDLERRHPNTLDVIQGDVGKVADNELVVRRAVERFGRIDGLVINAGTIEPARISSIPLDQANAYLSANLVSVLYLVQPALPYLRKSKGKVVMVSSGAASRGYTSWALYSMAKAGMNSLARTLANEEKDLSVWAIRPGLVDMQELLRSVQVMDADEHAKFTAAHANGQLLPPALPAALIAGLALRGPKELSGEYLDWADDRLAPYKLK